MKPCLFILLTLFVTLTHVAMPQTPAEAAFNRAMALQQDGHWEQAVPARRAFLILEPQHPGAHANLGMALSRLDQHEAAIASYETAMRLGPALTPRRARPILPHVSAPSDIASPSPGGQTLCMQKGHGC
ncbi:MAG: tetratricopeptide repeat protein [Blastocatellia bacterium]